MRAKSISVSVNYWLYCTKIIALDYVANIRNIFDMEHKISIKSEK